MGTEITITKEQYDKLNDYYNDLCLGLSINDGFFLNNVNSFGMICSKLYRLFDKLKEETKKEDCLTFLEIFNKAKEVLKEIEPKYLDDFDKIIDKGILEVDYERLDIPLEERSGDNAYFNANYDGRVEVYNPDKGNIHMEVSFNYDAIATLIHEYFHKVNQSDTQARYLLTEYISIYFEIYTYEILKKQGIDPNILSLNERLHNLLSCAEFIDRKGFFLGVYEKFGSYNDNMYDFLNYSGVTRNQFNEALLIELNDFERYEDEYNKSEKLKQDFSTKKDYIVSKYNKDYRYFLGILLTYFSIYNLDKDKILKLNEAVTNNNGMTFDQALNLLGITLDDNTIDECINSIERYMKENNLCKEENTIKM